MRIEVSIPFQSQIAFDQGRIETIGSWNLMQKISEFKKSQGNEPQTWPLIASPASADEILINEFIRKCKGEVFIYNHDELCHCRMVPTEKVKNAVKLGCHTIPEVSRTTLAGTGCGSCRKDIESVIEALKS